MDCSRRFFIGGCASFGALAGCGKIMAPFAASAPGAKLRFGVVSDIHLRNDGDETAFARALRFFRNRGVDAVMIAGDIADSGEYRQLKRCADAWYAAFPGGKAPDGRKVEQLFIYGNHCIEGWTWGFGRRQPVEWAQREAIGYLDNRRQFWEELFHEEYRPIWHKRVNGYDFIGAHWRDERGTAMPDWLAEHGRGLDPAKPFFFTQHPHPRNTCFGSWAWGADDGSLTQALSAGYPNAVTITGHSHYPLTDERSIWQGGFTSVNGASLRYAGSDYSFEDNLDDNTWGYHPKNMPKHRTPHLDTGAGKHGMVFSVYDDRIAIERREFETDRCLSLGDDWVLPLPTAEDRPYAYAVRASRRTAPQFAADAAAAVTPRRDARAGMMYDVVFPAAHTVDKCRVLDYEVSAVLCEDDVETVIQQKHVMATDYYLADSAAPRPELCVFAAADLPLKGKYRFRIRPIECFGLKGDAITSPIVEIA